MAETDEKQRLKAEIRKLEEALAKLDGENRRLLDRNEELQLAYDEADRDAREAEAMNGHLLRRVEEMEVQIAALRQYEAEFDKRVTSMLDERDEALASATRDKEAILLKVKELQEELALARRSVPGEAADAAELALMLKERQLEIEDLLDRNEELEHDLAKAREELQRAPRQAPTSAGTQPSGGLDQTSQDQYEERLRHFKADALEKDQRVLDAEKKLEQLARSLGAEGVVAENRELSRQNADMKRQVGEAKRDLANYLSEAANIVYENDLLRSIANVKPEQLKLKDFKLKDKVTSAKAVAAAKQMEKEVAELEAERGKLKARLRQLSELAAEKVSLLHNLQPEQMLQLEEIAARMRKGKLELPLDDQSRQLKEERDELSKRLAAKDREVAEHVDRKVEEVLKKQGATKDLEAKVAALEKDNEMLQSSLEAYKAGYAELVMQQGPQALEQLVGRLPGSVPLPPGAMARSLRPLPPGVTPPPPGPAGGRGLGAPAVLPKMPGMQPMVWSSLLQAVLQLPGELSDGSQETVCSLYCQVVEALEELSRERSLREGLAEEVSSFQQRFDRLLAEQEVLYKDYFAQREEWLATTRSLEERLRLQGDLLTDCQQKCEIQEGQMRTWQRLAEGTAPELQEELVSAMGRIAALEQNESVLSRKVEAERQGHSIVKEAFDNLQKDCCEREGFLKERLSKAVLWKRRGANALRIARRKIQSMVASSDYERVQQQLQVCRQREFDLSRRQTELTLKVAQQEDKLREMMDLQDRCRSLDHLVRETEQEFTVLRRRLQLREPRFAAEVALFTRLTAELQRTLGFVGSFEAAARALGLAEARVAGLGFEAGAAINVEASLDEKLRKFDVNNDGFITLGDLRKFFESLSIKVKEDELQLLAEALHGAQSQVTAPRPPPSAPGSLSPPAPPEPTAADKVNVSVLGVVGRFRLYGLRSLEPEELFWASFQALLFRLPDQPDAQQVLRSSFMRLRNAQGDIAAADVLSVLASYEVPANQLPLRSLRRVLQWLGVEARSLEEVLPAAQLPNPGDAQEPEFRLRLQKLRIVYQDFAQRMEKGLGRAQLQLRPPEALVVPAPPSPPADLEARCHAAQARESAANRRCVVLEQEVRTKDRIAKELQRQVGELDNLVERLESELYEERGSKVNLMAQLNASLPKAEVEPKLRQLEELKFQVDQSSLALKQSKDLARVCAAQAESYEQLVKRRQQEVRNLQESVKMLQAGDEVANTVGKLQYRLLLCQWEKGNVQRQLQTATQDLRQARRELLENEEQVEQERQEHDHTEEHLRHRLTEASAQAAQLAEQSAAAMPVDKARQLTSRLEEISSRKMELEERLSKVRLELLRNQAETDSCRLRAQQAQELLMELKALDPDSEAPRQRLLEMAKKLADSKLQELQHKRSLEIVKEQHQQLEKARQADEKEIQNLQREVANAESKLADQEQQWRAKVLEAQGAAPASAVRRAGQISIEALEEIQGKVSERDARIAVLESDLQKSMSDRESAVAEERAKVRKLELELGLVAEGDMAKLRQALRAEHDAEVAQISQAAQESVQTLQQLLDQTEEHLQRQQQDTARLHQNLSEQRAKHAEETMQLQQEIAGLRQEIFQIRHHQQSDVGASARLSPLPPPPPDESARLGDSIGSEAFGGMEGLGNRLDEQREQVVSLHHRLEQQHEEFQSLLDQQHQEARRREEQLRGREERLHQEYQAREQRLLDLQEAQRQQRDQELLRIKEELASLHSANGANAEAQQQREEQVAEAQRHADLALQHNAVAEQNRLSAENWQRKATELEAELQKERQKHQESTMRKQQASLRRQLANKEEQLGSLRKAVEELKDRVVQLTIRNEREEMESGNARRSESEVRKRITGQEGKMQSLKDQVARLSKQLQEQKAQATYEAARAGELDSREAALAQLLEASASQLAEKAAEARRFEELLLRQTRRATEAEEALRGERGVAEGEVKLVMKEGQAAAEANARRVGALLERLEALQAERLELSSKLHGAEAALAVLRGTARGGASVEAVANMAALKERLREEQDLRQALQEEVRDLSTQLEMAGPRVDQKTLSSPSPLRELTSQAPGSPLRQGTSRSGSRSPPASRSPAPRSLKQASELAARCGQLQAEVAALKARSTVLEQENDDLKLRVASDADPVTASAEIDMLRGSLENVNAQNRVLTTEIEAERLRHRAIYRRQGEEEELRRLQQQLNQAYQSLAAERQRISVLSQALEVERHMRVAPNTSDSSSAVALATARATIADLQQRLDEALKARVQLPPTGQPPREAELVAQVEELLRENTQLRRQVASPGAVRASAEQQVLQLQARIQELLRENMALQRAAESAPPIPPVPATPVATAVPVAAVPVAAPPPATAQPHPDTAVLMALQQQVAQLQARVQELLRENLDMQRRSPSPPPASGDAASLAAARRQNEELQARLQTVLRENLELQRRQSPAPSDAAALAAARRQIEELQARVQELASEMELQRRSQSPAPPGEAVAGASRQNAELQGRVQELLRENLELQGRSSDIASAAGATVRRQNEELQVRVQELLRENLELQRYPPPPPGAAETAGALAAAKQENEQLQGRVQELQRENNELRRQVQAPPSVPDDFGALDRALGAAKRQNEELEARVQELLRENLQLQRRSPSPPPDAPGEAALAAARHQNDELQVRMQGVLRDNLELQRRSPSPPGDAARQKNEELQARCFDLIQENDALRQQLAERSRDGSPHRSARRPAAEALRLALQRQELSLVKLLTGLDPQMHGKVSFEAFQAACSRHHLSLQADDFAKLAHALNLDKRGFFHKEALLRAFRRAEEVASPPRGRKASDGPSQTQSHARSGSREVHAPQGLGPVEVQHRRQIERLESRLFASEQERQTLQQELDAVRRQESAREEALQKPRSLSVLLSAGDTAPPFIKELKLEVKGTRELRDKLYNAETQLESYKRRLEVDARQELEKERHVVKQLQAELEEKERTVAELLFDLRRARNASGEGDWAQREEEYMRLDLQLRKLEEELASSRRAERDMADRLLQAEHVAMELRFDREQVHLRSSRLESRILELELLNGGDSPRRQSPLKTGAGAAAANLQSRKERNLENVIEGLERVVNQQKAENQRLKVALDRRPDDRRGRGRAEVERLRKRIEELESAPPRGQDSGNMSAEGPVLEAYRREVAAKEEVIQKLQEKLREGPGTEPPEMQRLLQELAELRRARGEDGQALDEAQRALQEAEMTEKRYLEVVRENRKLRQDLSALEDDGFWKEIESLQTRNQEAVGLAKESQEALLRCGTAAGVDVASLMARLETFAAAG